MNKIVKFDRSCVVSEFYPAEDFERLVRTNANRRRKERIKRERRERLLETIVNAALVGCIALGLVTLIWVV